MCSLRVLILVLNYRDKAVKMSSSIADKFNLHDVSYWTVEAESLDSKYVYINGQKMDRTVVPDIESIKNNLEHQWLRLPAHSYTFIMFL